MAHLRVIATAAVVSIVAGAACGTAGAESEPSPASGSSAGAMPGVIVPAGWVELPAIATAVRTAIGSAPAIPAGAPDGVRAWGEPAMGCYAVQVAMRGAGTAPAIAEQVIGGLTRAPGAPAAASSDPRAAPARPLSLRDVVKPTTSEGVLTLAFDRSPYRGRLRARIGGGTIVALACFANEREPVACEARCTGLLEGLP